MARRSDQALGCALRVQNENLGFIIDIKSRMGRDGKMALKGIIDSDGLIISVAETPATATQLEAD